MCGGICCTALAPVATTKPPPHTCGREVTGGALNVRRHLLRSPGSGGNHQNLHRILADRRLVTLACALIKGACSSDGAYSIQ